MKSLFFLIAIFFTAHVYASDCGTVKAFWGTVEATKGWQSSGPVTEGRQISCDEGILTKKNSSAIVTFPGGRMIVGPESRIEFIGGTDESPLKAINLFSGSARFFSEKHLEVRFTNATVTAGYADFYAAHAPVSQLAALQGNLEVKAADIDQPVQVTPGSEMTIEGANPQPKPLTPAVRQAARRISIVGRNDGYFIQPAAAAVLGAPEYWSMTPQQEQKQKAIREREAKERAEREARNRRLNRARYSVGLAYDTAGDLKFSSVTGTSGGQSLGGSASINISGSPALTGEMVWAKPDEWWGVIAGLNLAPLRKPGSYSINFSSGSTSGTYSGGAMVFAVISCDLLIRLQQFYFSLGLNNPRTAGNQPEIMSSISGTFGYEAGLGYFFSENWGAELKYVDLRFNGGSSVVNNVNFTVGSSEMSSIHLGAKYIF